MCKKFAGEAVRVIVQVHEKYFAIALQQPDYDEMTKTSGQTREFA